MSERKCDPKKERDKNVGMKEKRKVRMYEGKK